MTWITCVSGSGRSLCSRMRGDPSVASRVRPVTHDRKAPRRKGVQITAVAAVATRARPARQPERGSFVVVQRRSVDHRLEVCKWRTVVHHLIEREALGQEWRQRIGFAHRLPCLVSPRAVVHDARGSRHGAADVTPYCPTWEELTTTGG